jgi:hypothetical protein
MPRKLVEIFQAEIPKHYDRKKGLRTAAVVNSSTLLLVAGHPHCDINNQAI